jgi:hypothetical protein
MLVGINITLKTKDETWQWEINNGTEFNDRLSPWGNHWYLLASSNVVETVPSGRYIFRISCEPERVCSSVGSQWHVDRDIVGNMWKP